MQALPIEIGPQIEAAVLGRYDECRYQKYHGLHSVYAPQCTGCRRRTTDQQISVLWVTAVSA